MAEQFQKERGLGRGISIEVSELRQKSVWYRLYGNLRRDRQALLVCVCCLCAASDRVAIHRVNSLRGRIVPAKPSATGGARLTGLRTHLIGRREASVQTTLSGFVGKYLSTWRKG